MVFFTSKKLYNLDMDFVGIEKLSLVDYDGKISCILFTEHCNFRCPFCHNSALVLGKNNFAIPFEDILSYLKKRKGVLDGVVISGGEPTLMPDLKEKIKAIKDLGYAIKLDSNGTHPETIKDLYESGLIDYVAMDIKNSPDGYPEIVGTVHVDMDKIKESIHYLKTSGIDYEFRTTLVSEFHDEERIEEMGKMIEGAKCLFLQKFISSEHCIETNLNPVDENTANKYKEILSKYVKKVSLRGY